MYNKLSTMIRRLKRQLLITLALAVIGGSLALYSFGDIVRTRVSPIQTVENHAQMAKTMDSSNCKHTNFSSMEHGKGTDILLNSYMRSGSTFLSRVLGWRKDAFYIHEPLWKTHQWQYFSGTKLCNYSRPLCHEDAGSASLNKSLSVLEDVFRCNLQGIYHKLFPDFGGPSWEAYRHCTRGKKNATMKCILLATDICLEAQHRVTKVLRMDLDIAASLLCQNPRLKIVQLFRDPRSILNSHISTSFYPLRLDMNAQIELDVSVICSRMEHDINVYKTLMKQYPTRVIAVQYEDFGDLSFKSKLLFRFLDIEFPENDSALPLSFSGSPFRYRDTLPWGVMKIADKYCENVYRELGLIKFKNELELRNKIVSPILGNLTFSLLSNNIISNLPFWEFWQFH